MLTMSPPGQAGWADTLVPGRESAARLEQSHGFPQDMQDAPSGFPLVCYTGCTGHSVTGKTFLSLTTGSNRFPVHPLFPLLLFKLVLAVRKVFSCLNLLYLHYFLLPYAQDCWKIDTDEGPNSPSWPGLYLYFSIRLPLNTAILCICQPLYLIAKCLQSRIRSL